MPLTWRDWDPFSEFEALHREVNRLFEEWGLGGWQSPFSRFSFLPGLSARAYPLLNVTEDDGAVYVEALAPGGGYVFNTIHNIQGDVPPGNIVAMYEALEECGAY